ncbi:MAG: SIMPL domain-containing protein [Bdellovibrionales bacterium]|nr:SIMPL domain-containing protein [Bdellovibrionales bacterium]
MIDFMTICSLNRTALALLISAPTLVLAQVPTGPFELPNDLTVTADAWTSSAPDYCRVNAIVDGRGSSAALAHTGVNELVERLQKELRAQGMSASISRRGASFEGISTEGATTPLESAGSVRVRQALSIETSSLADVPAIIDLLLRNGVDRVSEVSYLVRDPEATKRAALEQAVARAKLSAQELAEALGVKLGEVLSVSAQEDPAGAMIRRNKIPAAQSAPEFQDEEFHLYVTVRFAIAGAEGQSQGESPD